MCTVYRCKKAREKSSTSSQYSVTTRQMRFELATQRWRPCQDILPLGRYGIQNYYMYLNVNTSCKIVFRCYTHY